MRRSELPYERRKANLAEPSPQKNGRIVRAKISPISPKMEFFNTIGSHDTLAALVASGRFGEHDLSLRGARTRMVRTLLSLNFYTLLTQHLHAVAVTKSPIRNG